MPPPKPANYTLEFTPNHFLTKPQLYCGPHHKLLRTLSRAIHSHISLIDPSDTNLTNLHRHLTIRTTLNSLLPLPQSISARTQAELRRRRIHEMNKVIELTVQKAVLAAMTLDRAGFSHDEMWELMHDTLAYGMTEGSFCRAHIPEVAFARSGYQNGNGSGNVSGSGSGSGCTDGSSIKMHGFCRFSAETATILLARLALNLMYEPEPEPDAEVDVEVEVEAEKLGGETPVERQGAQVGYVTSNGWMAINRG